MRPCIYIYIAWPFYVSPNNHTRKSDTKNLEHGASYFHGKWIACLCILPVYKQQKYMWRACDLDLRSMKNLLTRINKT